MAAPMGKNEITLGFVEKAENWRLSRRFFPSKVGGKPAWLSMKDIPNSDNLKCRNCGIVCIFLMQVYCPISELDTCFHRTVFIFCCRDPACHTHASNSAFLVFRSQLPRANEFYDYEPPDEDSSPGSSLGAADEGLLCEVCGCFGGKKCAKCHVKSYCCREHQLVDWKAGHNKECGSLATGLAATGKEKILFPEFELVTESEDYSHEDKDDTGTEECHVAEDRQGLGVEELEKMALTESKEDRQFAKFKNRTDYEPDQVIRYQRGGQPLLISTENQPQQKDIPPCTSCGSVRQFEFQVMPQLLLHLDVDSLGQSIDWGTLLIYTCAKSCKGVSAYLPEFLWKQDVAVSDE
ncbi:programmed cell death protein 2-like [Acanthaster planci]|uniref:Programmed cell death protein 2-like n=1 Tax=Acanthaster planci TaxID=133434 RepID=A0A8B7XTC8_ACAPL|nr:programmed cell death protein 2-like [Acanthaster planci]